MDIIKCDYCGTKNPVYNTVCKSCGLSLEPFNLTHPEYNLVSRSTWIARGGATGSEYPLFDKVRFDYIEDGDPDTRTKEFRIIVKRLKFGVIIYQKKLFWGDALQGFIPCEYDMIKRVDEGFLCKKGNVSVIIGKNGELLSRKID